LLGEVSATIAHEFNNVLMGATMSVEVAARQLPAGTAGADAVGRARASLGRLQEFSQKILRFTRPAAAALQPVELASWAARVAAEVSVQLPSSVNLSVSVQDGVILADVSLLDQAVINLIINARDAGATKIAFAVERPRGQVRISVGDNGGGIPPAFRDKLFEPLATTKVQGNGLGLSLVYSAVAEHRGEIEVESTLGKGTKFTIILQSAVPNVQAGA
jgi:signal transduction histidine kinase